MTTVQSIQRSYPDYRGRRYYASIPDSNEVHVVLIKTSNWKPGYSPVIPHFLIRSMRELNVSFTIKIEN